MYSKMYNRIVGTAFTFIIAICFLSTSVGAQQLVCAPPPTSPCEGTVIYYQPGGGSEDGPGTDVDNAFSTQEQAVASLNGATGCLIELDGDGQAISEQLCQPDSGETGATVAPSVLYALMGLLAVALFVAGRALQLRGQQVSVE